MTFRQFTFLNVMRNKRLYAAYFLSSLFSVLVFFVYAIFAFHPALADGQLPGGVSRGLHTAEGIIYVFSFFFILYSMSAFLKSRSKEFGLLVMHGMTGIQLRAMVFWENMLLGVAAVGGGIGIGLAFAKAILLTAENVLGVEQQLNFYFPAQALALTFTAFLILFAIISLFTMLMIRHSTILELLKGSAKPRPEPKASLILSALAALLIGGGYTVSLIARGMEVIVAFLPVTLAVIFGTYLLFAQLSVYVINGFKRIPRIFWRKTNMITLADLAYRMKDNARTFFIVTIVSTVAFCAIGSLFSFIAIAKQQTHAGHPYSLDYLTYRFTPDDADRELARQWVEQQLESLGIAYEAYSYTYSYWLEEGDRNQHVAIMSTVAYNHFAAIKKMPELALSDNETVMLANAAFITDRKISSVTLTDGTRLEPSQVVASNPLPAATTPVYVVSSEQYRSLEPPNATMTQLMWDIADEQDELRAGQHLAAQNSSHLLHRVYAKAYDLHQMLQAYYVVLFIGLFIGIVFFVAAGSFLYFRLYSDLENDRRTFASLAKMGLTREELSRIISRQLALLFFAPVAVALVHGAIALKAMQSMFLSNLIRESALVLGCFLAIQILYYAVVRYYYIRNIRQSCKL